MSDEIVELPYNFEPRHYQDEVYKAFFIDKKKRIIDVLHRRAGKDKTYINLICEASQLRVGTYLYLFPELNQARRVIWNGIDKEGFKYTEHIPHALRKKTNNSDMMIEMQNGSVIQLAGSDRYDSLMGTNPIGVVFSEFSLQNPRAFDYIRPILAENGGWAIFQYTPRGRNHGYDLFVKNKENPDWYVRKYGINVTRKNDGSPVITEEMIEEERRAGMPEELIQQEFYVSFEASMVGSYYGKHLERAEKEGRIREVKPEPGLHTYTFWDLGVKDPTAIWFMQFHGGKVRIINYYEQSDASLKDHIKYLADYAEKNRITYGAHFAPHDIRVREFTNNRSRFEIAREMGLRFHVVPMLSIDDGIEATWYLFKDIYFDKENCEHGINCLRHYHKKYDEKRKCFGNKPEHDWSSHGADAFRYLAVGWNDYYASPMDSKPIRYA